MHRVLVTVTAIALSTGVVAQTPTARSASAAAKPAVVQTAEANLPLVEFEAMTWPEVKQALADGKTTALFYTGGT